MVPPRKMIYVGSGDFLAVGREFLTYFVELCDLKPTEHVLDVGCGIGRLAVPLTQYLSADGRYEGFDIVADGIEWCRRRISTKYPNFEFKLIDVSNSMYNPSGRANPAETVFPYQDDSFDFVFLASVFTHMLPDGVANYLSEIARVLRPGGRCLMTAFLLNDDSKGYLGEGLSQLYPRFNAGSYSVISKDSPEITVFHEEDNFISLINRSGLQIRSPIRYGAWCSRRAFLSYQDIIVVARAASP